MCAAIAATPKVSEPNPLVLKQPAFAFQSSAIPGQRRIHANDAMAGHD
jgi:hypothetical protein